MGAISPRRLPATALWLAGVLASAGQAAAPPPHPATPPQPPVHLRPAVYGKPAAILEALDQLAKERAAATRSATRPAVKQPPGKWFYFNRNTLAVRYTDFWQIEPSAASVMFVARKVPNLGVLLEWGPTQDLPPEERAKLHAQWLAERYAGVERLRDSRIAGFPAHYFIWVEDPNGGERRESWQAIWVDGTTLCQVTVTAPISGWAHHGQEIFSLIGVYTVPKPKSAPAAASDPIAAAIPQLQAAIAATHDKPADAKGKEHEAALSDGWKLRFADSWKLVESEGSYLFLTSAASPDVTVAIEWIGAGKEPSLDNVCKRQRQRLAERYAKVEALPNRTIGASPARQTAWISGAGAEACETLEVDWLDGSKLFRASISGPPDFFKEQGPDVLRLLADIAKGGKQP